MDAMNASAAPLAALPPFTPDLVYVAITVAFFAIAVVYARLCGKLR